LLLQSGFQLLCGNCALDLLENKRSPIIHYLKKVASTQRPLNSRQGNSILLIAGFALQTIPSSISLEENRYLRVGSSKVAL
jgi:hypothetical protein